MLNGFFKMFMDWIKNKFKKPQANAADVETPVEVEEPVKVEPINKIGFAIIVGHEKKAPGATMKVSKQSEYEYNKEVANLMINYCKNFPVLSPKIYLRDGVGIVGAYRNAENDGKSVCIELHFNAYNGIASGSETLCSNDKADIAFAGIVQKNVCKVFKRQKLSRGIKSLGKQDRGGTNVNASAKMVNCLVEPFFGDNEYEAMMALELKYDYAKCLVDSVLEYYGGKRNMP
jgi:hypothetical protein